MTARAALPAGDPARSYWTYEDLAAHFELAACTVRRRLAEWEGQGFPQPLPWSRRERRWRPAAVIRWGELRESAAMARAPLLSLVATRT